MIESYKESSSINCLLTLSGSSLSEKPTPLHKYGIGFYGILERALQCFIRSRRVLSPESRDPNGGAFRETMLIMTYWVQWDLSGSFGWRASPKTLSGRGLKIRLGFYIRVWSDLLRFVNSSEESLKTLQGSVGLFCETCC